MPRYFASGFRDLKRGFSICVTTTDRRRFDTAARKAGERGPSYDGPFAMRGTTTIMSRPFRLASPRLALDRNGNPRIRACAGARLYVFTIASFRVHRKEAMDERN